MISRNAIGFLATLVVVAPAVGQSFVQFDSRMSHIAIRGEIEQAPPPYDKIGGEVFYIELGAFDDSVTDSSEYYELSIGGAAAQVSQFDAHAISASGSAYSKAFDDYGYAGAWGSAEGQFELTLTLFRNVRIEFEAEIGFNYGSDPASLHGTVSLTGPGGVVFSQVSPGTSSDAVVLPPGVYDLACNVDSYSDLGAGGGDAYISGTASFTLNATLRVHGDLTGDDKVDLSDLAALLANYGVPGPHAYEDGDLDQDGDIDLSDLADLLANYDT